MCYVEFEINRRRNDEIAWLNRQKKRKEINFSNNLKIKSQEKLCFKALIYGEIFV